MASPPTAIRLSPGVELVLGNLFDSDADFLVIPCDTAGRVAADFATELASRGITPAAGELELGAVVVASSPSKASQGPSVIFAAVVPWGGTTTVATVGTAASRVARLVPAGSKTAFPLLGAGAGALEPRDSLDAIATGFLVDDGKGAVASIHVENPGLFERLLTERAQRSDVPPRPREAVPTHTDGPAMVDELGRRGFARVLARRIRDARAEEARQFSGETDPRRRRGGAFLLHLHAPWGAGKTSLLNFLAAQLRTDDPATGARRCVVVEFNAWRHQRVGPPWWWLMAALYGGAVRELSRFDRRRAYLVRGREWFWRLKGGWPGYVALLLVAAILVVAWQSGWFGALRGENLASMDAAGRFVAVAAVVTSLLTIWGLLHGVGRWVFTNSARGAKRFLDNTNDPMRVVQEHLADLAGWIRYDVVVMIDDLDRCRAPYVVELLEGIQTLFRDVPMTYVVASDRDWLANSYAAEYADFPAATAEPGRPLGYLFLEKTFQVSTGLPRVGGRLEGFWGRILRSAQVLGETELDRAREDARRDLGDIDPGTALGLVAANPGATPADVQARLETVAVEMVSERAQQRDVHVLEPFRELLGPDPNPRMMKRLVNAYGIARGVETLQGQNLAADRHREQQTALWVILCLRWPQLGAYLARDPSRVGLIGEPAPAGVPDDLRPLFVDPDVVAVVNGEAPGIDATLIDADLTSVTPA